MGKGRTFMKIRGSLGKSVVVKQYKDGEVFTQFPDMSKIVASGEQRNCRNVFKEAVEYAKAINNDPEKKKAYKGKTRKNQSVFNAAISEYMKMVKEEKL